MEIEFRTPTQLSDEEWGVLVQDYKAGMGFKDLERKHRVRGGSITTALRRAEVPRRDVARQTTSFEQLSDEDVAAVVVQDREKEGLKAQAAHYQRLYKEAIRSAATQEVLVQALRETVQAMPVLSSQSVVVPRHKADGTHTAVLQLSDLHVGEVVSQATMGGLGQYNLDIFRQRVGLWLQKVIHLVDLRRGRLEIPRLVVLADGDFVSGGMVNELVRTNVTHVMHQAIYTAKLIAFAIAQLARLFEEVVVSCTVGNHGRLSIRPEFKDPDLSWDYLCYQHMAAELRGYENVEFDIPCSPWQITKVESLDILHFHGHGIRSWAGFPWYGIDRAVKSLRQALAMGDRSFDVVAMGHFHVPLEFETPTGPWLVNGSWIGGTEFALAQLHTTLRPSQVLFFVHDRHGVIGRELIYLHHQLPEHAEGLPLADHELPAVWIGKDAA